MKNEEFLTEKALEVITKARHEALAGNRLMTYYHLGKLDTFIYLLGYPDEFNCVFNNILRLLAENE